MSVPQHFSRQFFADFIASRIKAWNLEEGNSRPQGRPPSSLGAGDSGRVETGAAGSTPIDEPGGPIAGLESSGP